ncbi:WXG100 family type VII secretion target [Micromonospora eburnea]|uniref:Proteins of 100 residues with WXG n=1 Tax=Micromonospora eburnea TaxID=227316 RepID=A0A1C6VH90_9ACTN|nr:hypothetical protein [Micromonospora eburnea]SCL65424.1 hypothetical protein GA0070604_5432 [Micromonospora eburnea]
MAQISSSAAAAKIALVEISIAAAVIPAAWPVAQIVYFNQCDPEAMMDVAGKWIELANQLGSAREGLDDAVGAVLPTQWSGEDRDAFDRHIRAYDIQVVGSQVVAVTVAVTLIAVGVALLCLVIAYTVVCTVLFAFAVFIAAAAATVVGAPAAASAEATANSFAASALALLKSLEATAEVIATGGAATVGAALAVDVGMQLGTGNTDVLKNLVQATIDGLDNVAVGFLSKWERDFVGYGIHNSGKHVAGSPNGPGSLMFGLLTQIAPAGDDGEGNTVFGPGGIVDNIWSLGFDGDAWNH